MKIITLTVSLLVYFPVLIRAQQPVLKSKQVAGGSGASYIMQSKVDKSPKQSLHAQVVNDIKSIDTSLTDGAEVILVKPVKAMGAAMVDAEVAEGAVVVAPSNININFLPLYGNANKTDLQRLDDAIFLADCEKNFDSKEEASLFFSKIAWGYLSEGGKDLATHRFYLAYLLNPKNQDIYWGLGVISYQKEELHQAMNLLEKGIELSPVGKENPTMLVDLASIYIKCFMVHKLPSELESAYNLLDKALLINPSYANAYMQLSLAHLADDDLAKAWLHFHQGYEVNPLQADVSILEELLAKSKDPKGIFRQP